MASSKIYYGCGLPFECELDLPGIPVATSQRPLVSIRFGNIPTDSENPLTGQSWYVGSPNSLRILIPDIAEFLVTNGNSIVIQPHQNASDTDLRLFLLGSAFGALLHQRGVLPLHASSVCVDDGYAAFVGNSGDGKSTHAAILHQAGYTLAGDDICPIAFSSRGVSADLGFTRMKLWSTALEFLEIEKDGLERSDFDRDKYDVPTFSSAGDRQRPLRGIYVLEYVDNTAAVGIQRVTGQTSLPVLLQHTYRYCFVEPLGLTEQHFWFCMQLAKCVPIYKLRRCRGPEFFSQTVELLKAHWESDGATKIASAA